MLKFASISASPLFHEQVRTALRGRVSMDGACQIGYSDFQKLRALQGEENCLVVLDFSEAAPATRAARELDINPALAMVAVGAGQERDVLLQMMRLGIREVVDSCEPANLLEASLRAIRKMPGQRLERTGNIYAFVPAKPGAGATTVATHTAAALAESSDKPTLLLDFDVRLGITSFLLKIDGSHTIVDALEHADHLDESLWSGMVSQREHLDVLGSGPLQSQPNVSAARFMGVLDFAQTQYSHICVDLPGTMEDQEAQTLRRAQHVFMVCTADVGGLHMARRKASWFDELQIRDKLSIVLNCVERRMPFSVKDIEKVIQCPVRFLLPAEPNTVGVAVQKGVAIRGNSPLAKQISILAKWLNSEEASAPRPARIRRFVEYFSISPARREGTFG